MEKLPIQTSQKKQTLQTSLRFVADLLLKKPVITDLQHAMLLKESEKRSNKLQKYQEANYSKRGNLTGGFISPAEIISSFNLEVPNSQGYLLSEDDITEALASTLKIEYYKIDPLKLKLDTVTTHIPRPFATRHLIVPLEETDNIITVAVADPFNLEPVETLKTTKRLNFRIVLSSKSDILHVLREFFGFRRSVAAAEKEVKSDDTAFNLDQYTKLKGREEIESTDHHIINTVEYILHYAFEQRASDIHIEPKREKSYLRLRIDGDMHYIHTIPKSVHAPIVSRIKTLSRMNIAEKRKPQDGRIKTDYNGHEIELRVSTMPVAFGEKIVIRIFDPELLMQEVDMLGLYPREYQLYNAFINRPNGVVLVTGPTGSGKTTTLYSSLKSISAPELNIITVEDPIEMVMEDFNQVGVQPAVGVTFPHVLRTILRQDPDIIMVGEIRDKETAEHVIQAALTGHMVISTLHTNDAPSSITRLLDLGVPPFLLSSTLIGIAAQRLIRNICPHCKRERKITKEELKYLKIERNTFMTFYGEGCKECRGTGYKGRSGIFEVMEFTSKMSSMLQNKIDLGSIRQMALQDGMVTLRDMAIRKMREGKTTYEEVIAVT